ncbi:hypothetical protein EGI16_03360 [Chryseobacterium sp. G0240]|uniref:hypothetical protein n=1 Tax=Chryseobacterium sp. G0240 TaxID=2487066 RepID=UPI000F451817|nr:hypothetical protein [Chryseobacterium sp. G0240]ROI05437.1 hypothetical protein EGI16_03360 [Chryseobacterium sp. G0240]
MKKMNLFYEPTEEQYYILYRDPGRELLFKVDQINPTMLSRIIERAIFLNSNERGQIIKEMEEFAKTEIEKLETGY